MFIGCYTPELFRNTWSQHRIAALPIITHPSRQSCRTDSCQIRYNICKFKGLRNRHYRYGFSISIGNIVNGTEPRISTNSQTSDWHMTSKVPWALTSEMLRVRILDGFVYRQHIWLRKGEVIVWQSGWSCRIYGSKAAKGFSAFNVCLVIVKIMTCNKKFPPKSNTRTLITKLRSMLIWH